MQIKSHFNCSCNLKTICTLCTQLFIFSSFLSAWTEFSQRSWAAEGVYMTGGPVRSGSRSILQTWSLVAVVVVSVDWEAARHRWNPVTPTTWLICWINDECPASSPFHILNNLKGQITPAVGALPTGSRWCFECCWWVPSPWIQSEDEYRWCLCAVRKAQTTWTVVYLNEFVFCIFVWKLRADGGNYKSWQRLSRNGCLVERCGWVKMLFIQTHDANFFCLLLLKKNIILYYIALYYILLFYI